MYDSVIGSYLTTPTGVAIQISPDEWIYILSIIGLGKPFATLRDSSHREVESFQTPTPFTVANQVFPWCLITSNT